MAFESRILLAIETLHPTVFARQELFEAWCVRILFSNQRELPFSISTVVENGLGPRPVDPTCLAAHALSRLCFIDVVH